MKEKIVIKSFSALSFDLVVEAAVTTNLNLPDLAPARLRPTPEDAQGLKVHPSRPAERQAKGAGPAHDMALTLLRGGSTSNPVTRCLSHGC